MANTSVTTGDIDLQLHFSSEITDIPPPYEHSPDKPPPVEPSPDGQQILDKEDNQRKQETRRRQKSPTESRLEVLKEGSIGQIVNKQVGETFTNQGNKVCEEAVESLFLNLHDNKNLSEDEELVEASGFTRELLWTNEDISTLFGRNLPIFSHGNCRYICIKLKDTETSISVLTGLDSWSDHQLSKCNHRNYIVQKFKKIPTEEITGHGEIADHARHILGFLNSKGAKEGHTYWSYEDNEGGMLYDMNSLCSETDTENIFIVVVGSLIYGIAKHLWQQKLKKKRAITISFLENCLLLLHEDKHAQAKTAVCYMLSDLFVPKCAVNGNSYDDNCEYGDIDDSEHSQQDNTAAISDVALHSESPSNIQTILTENGQEGLNIAFQYIAWGLKMRDVMQHQNEEEKTRCYSNVVIPLPWYDTSLEDMEHFLVSTLEPIFLKNYFHLSTVLLLHKAGIAFYAKAKSSFGDNLSCSFDYLKLALQCLAVSRKKQKFANGDEGLLIQILSLAGEIYYENINRSEDIEIISPEYSEDENTIMDSVNRELETFEYEWVFAQPDDMKGRLLLCCSYYSVAIKKAQFLTTDLKPLQKCHGSILNELGVLYMKEAQYLLENSDGIFPKEEFDSLCKQSSVCLKKGMSRFQLVGDKANKATLMLNKGLLYQLKAQKKSKSFRTAGKEFSTEERNSYLQAVNCFQKSFKILGDRQSFPEIWESICWELSTTYFSMAILRQEHPAISTHSQEEVPKEVIELLSKSLEYCKKDMIGQQLYADRAGTINHKLAAIYHEGSKNQVNNYKQNKMKKLAESHYKKAVEHFLSIDFSLGLACVCVEQIALQKYFFSKTKNRCKKETLTLALSRIVSCRGFIQSILKQSQEADFEEKSKQAMFLAKQLLSQLQFVLDELKKCPQGNQKRMKKAEMARIKRLHESSVKIEERATTELEKLLMMLSVLDDVGHYINENT